MCAHVDRSKVQTNHLLVMRCPMLQALIHGLFCCQAGEGGCQNLYLKMVRKVHHCVHGYLMCVLLGVLANLAIRHEDLHDGHCWPVATAIYTTKQIF